MGDSDAWEWLVDKYSKRVFNIAFQFTGNYEDSEDLAQEVFLKVYHSLNKFDIKTDFLPWLIRLTKNYCIDDYRARRRSRKIIYEEDLISKTKDFTHFPLHSVLEKERTSLITNGLQKLPEDLRTAVVLRDIHGFNYLEISQILDIPEGTVKSRINRGRIELARVVRKGKQTSI
jgi:RNA polymerase sigma-70 factor (ECF subfamily)